MAIKEFIQNQTLLPRLKRNGILVVYDPEVRYRDLCLEMATETLRVIDAGESSITGREVAIEALNELGRQGTNLEGMVVYVPAPRPVTDEEKQRDPFALYTTCGSVFPNSDGDEYMNLCLKAKPDHATEIRRVFSENPNPTFAVIDAVGGGTGWPNLQTLLKVESALDILFALLAPSETQQAALKGEEAWVSEAKELFATCLGMKLITRAKTWPPIADELWRFLLFSEFVFDLPEALPDALSNVPRATDEARPLVEGLCDQLRNDQRAQALYIDRAESIERDLDLPGYCASLENLGDQDTFPFEERWFLGQAIDALTRDDTDAVRAILGQHTQCVWVGRGESQAQWELIRSVLSLCEACDDYERQLPDHTQSLDALIDFYIDSLREADRLQREFEQSVGDYIDAYDMMGDVIGQARKRYRRLAAKVQDVFIHHFEKTGWPPAGRLANADVFDSQVAPKLQESGRRVAYLLIDSLRYELGVALEKQLAGDGQVTIQPAFAQLPTITSVGMASLLPGAGQTLYLEKQDSDVIPVLGAARLTNVNQRMDVLRQKYGERFAEMTLNSFIRAKKKLPSTVDLLVLRSAEIDTQLETVPEDALGLIYNTLRRIRVAIHKLKSLGFQDVVIATDHGFFLNTHAEAGDVCAKPSGNWATLHDRLVIGQGTEDSANYALPAEHLGIRGDIADVGGPRGLVPYRAGEQYFHGGASLQECVVPVLTIRLSEEEPDAGKPNVVLSYKNGATRITTRLPVIDLLLEVKQLELFHEKPDLDILLEAHDKKSNIVGEAKAGGPVNPATGTITLSPDERIQVILKMQLEFEGRFTVKALNPTTLAAYCQIDLETDYTV